jgi:hypothetical protein
MLDYCGILQSFLEWCVDVVDGKEGNSKGHFRHAGLTIEEL